MRLSFVELTVADVAAATAWYRDVLGLEVLQVDTGRFALLAAGATRLALKVGVPSPGGVLLAFEVDDLVPMRGLSGDVKWSDEGYRRLRLRDRDGYGITLFEWLPKADSQGLDCLGKASEDGFGHFTGSEGDRRSGEHPGV